VRKAVGSGKSVVGSWELVVRSRRDWRYRAIEERSFAWLPSHTLRTSRMTDVRKDWEDE
jgi:hypothetical protein